MCKFCGFLAKKLFFVCGVLSKIKQAVGCLCCRLGKNDPNLSLLSFNFPQPSLWLSTPLFYSLYPESTTPTSTIKLNKEII